MLVEALWYRNGSAQTTDGLTELAARVSADGGFAWAWLDDPTPADIAEVAAAFDLHPLAVEDAIKARQRPKVERYDDWLFVVARTARYLDEPEVVELGEIQIFAAPSAIVVIRHGTPAPLSEFQARLSNGHEDLGAGPVALLHSVIDLVVDAYQHCLTGLDDDINEVELDVFSEVHQMTDRRVVERIYFLQRESLELHRAVSPLILALPSIRQDELLVADPAWDAYFRDIEDHLHRQIDQLQALRELLASALQANATQVNLRQNEDMRRISAWVAIAAVPTMVAAIYGMNFEHMPELDSVAGYPLALAAMAITCVALYRLFRRSGWL